MQRFINFKHGLMALLLTAALSLGLIPPQIAQAIGEDGTPTQIDNDGVADESNPSGLWGDMTGGATDRPYIQSLSAINGETTTPIITSGTTDSSTPVVAGDVTAVVTPYNLCKTGQDPSPGVCYATPNRIGVTVAYGNGDNDGTDFRTPSQTVAPTVDANTIFDMTIKLNTLGKDLRWTWINGDLVYWQPSNLGQDNATVRIKFKPVRAPHVTTFPDDTGCTATPITNCSIAQEDDHYLSASLVLSLDDTLDAALTGAAFATQSAIFGYLAPAGTTEVPTLDIQASSTHLRDDDAPQLGILQAFLPQAVIVNRYGVLPGDATSTFSTTRAGSAGTNDAPTYTNWTADTEGSTGLMVTVNDISFSIPKYKVKSKIKKIHSDTKVNDGKVTLTAQTTCSASRPCDALVYDLGRGVPRYQTSRHLLRNVTVSRSNLEIRISAKQLKPHHRYLLYLRSAKSHKPLQTSLGTVKS